MVRFAKNSLKSSRSSFKEQHFQNTAYSGLSHDSRGGDEKNEKMFQWMALASMMNDDDGPNDAEAALVHDIER